MFSLRSKSSPAGVASALTLVLAVVALLALPVGAQAAPEGGEESPPPPPQLNFEPGSHDFGLQEVNRSTSQAYLQLRNTGSVSAPIYSLEVSGSSAFWIGGSDCYGRTLEAGETCSVQVDFNPSEAVPLSAQLRAGSAEGASASAALSGEGGRAAIAPTVNPFNFGSVPVGSSVTKTVDLVNSGNMPGGLFIAVIAGGAVGSFHLLDEDCTGIPLSPGATCNLQVSFQPLSPGAKTGRLGLFGDGEGGTLVTLTGVGLEPEPELGDKSMAGGPLPQPGVQRKRHWRHHSRRGRGLHLGQQSAIADRREIG